ncbi:sensor histidine kinase [Desulforamulus aquiferis]|uniref:histidine kinase n=1 Tax=Desulforamulus aquiferis TaxID=1397668 RepID=A0AAW7Z9F6_9FIRM|nr:HAMP domain-containing sensor histidine kinase [Desulforamulus aquiferis]MDO7785889.1 HAMP domain-containing sensor histidine kinase [Desulforamulus aquiferis]RYD02149.1 hypothetical protein N752_27240 [Desulforamulus aquiferis]
MFTKLRNKFLIINMSITSIVMIIAFAIIYFMTYSNIQGDIQNKLASRAERQLRIEGIELPMVAERRTIIFPSDDLLAFSIEVNSEGEVLKISSVIDMPEEAYFKAAKAAWRNKKDYSTVTLEGKQWQYVITQASQHVFYRNGLLYTSTERNYQITFLDVTVYTKTLFELLITLLFVGLIMLFAIFIISLYFANRAIRPIAQTWEKQKQFIADASHELKTPLSIINANYDLLLANQEETIKSQIKWFSYIKIGTDRMTKLINELLSLAKIEDINFKVIKMPFNISNAINDVILSMEVMMNEKGIKLNRSIEPDIIVKGDAERVKQVITILLENAIKYSDDNGSIDVLLIRQKRQAVCSIKNTGKGIAKKDLPKIFDRFYRADSSRTHENGGYGLGLSIAKTTIERLGGEIYVNSVENKETTFTFTLEL